MSILNKKIMPINKNIATILTLSAISICSSIAQNYEISFRILGSEEQPTTVKVENKTQNTEITLEGSNILNLVEDVTSRISNPNSTKNNNLTIYPNPIRNTSTLSFNNPETGEVMVNVINVKGENVARINKELPRGEVIFALEGFSTGCYVVNVSSKYYNSSLILQSKIEHKHAPSISLISNTHSTKSVLKSTALIAETIKMQYNDGDELKFTATINDRVSIKDNFIAQSNAIVEFAIPYFIMYHNVGTKNSPENPSVYTIETSDIILELPADSIGFSFGGWFTDLALSDTISSPAIALGSIGDTSFYAKWISPPIYDDRDGKVYQTVYIGNQLWMAENLAYLPKVDNNHDFVAKGYAAEPAYGVYGYDGSEVSKAKENANYNTYGVLYNFYAISKTNVCPIGWHVPSDDEWKTLEMELGMTINQANENSYRGTNQGSQLAWNIDLWTNGNLVEDKKFASSGFKALPSGYRNSSNGAFSYLGESGGWWTSSVNFSSSPFGRALLYSQTGVGRLAIDPLPGRSIRCVKD